MKKKKRLNDKGKEVPEVCKCGGKIGCFLRGEPVWLCTKCNKYYGTLPFNEAVSSLMEAANDIEQQTATQNNGINIKSQYDSQIEALKKKIAAARAKLAEMDAAKKKIGEEIKAIEHDIAEYERKKAEELARKKQEDIKTTTAKTPMPNTAPKKTDTDSGSAPTNFI